MDRTPSVGDGAPTCLFWFPRPVRPEAPDTTRCSRLGVFWTHPLVTNRQRGVVLSGGEPWVAEAGAHLSASIRTRSPSRNREKLSFRDGISLAPKLPLI
jgi:hypothetical protein